MQMLQQPRPEADNWRLSAAAWRTDADIESTAIQSVQRMYGIGSGKEGIIDFNSRRREDGQTAQKDSLDLFPSPTDRSGRREVFGSYCPPRACRRRKQVNCCFIDSDHASKRTVDKVKLVLKHQIRGLKAGDLNADGVGCFPLRISTSHALAAIDCVAETGHGSIPAEDYCVCAPIYASMTRGSDSTSCVDPAASFLP